MSHPPPSTHVQLNLAPKVAKVHAQDVELQLKKLQRRKLPWMEAAKDTPSGNLLTTAAPALVTEPASAASTATAAAMAATETEPAEVAGLVQARSPPLSSSAPSTHAATHRAAQVTPSSQHRCKWSSRKEKPS